MLNTPLLKNKNHMQYRNFPSYFSLTCFNELVTILALILNMLLKLYILLLTGAPGFSQK